MEKFLHDNSGFRKLLHRNAELSGKESKTNEIINSFLKLTKPDRLISNIGGNGIAAVYGSGNENTTMFRADIDALPIKEINDFSYKSETDGVAHKCGHDGHTSILSALSVYLKENRPAKGKVILLFQPAEETGEGAARVLSDPLFNEITPDRIFGFHNLPGYDKNEIVMIRDTFAAASRGLICRLNGKTSHAAEPEKGISPAPALAEVIKNTYQLTSDTSKYSGFTLLTIIHAVLGEKAFGTSPGQAQYMATLRAFRDADIIKLENEVRSICVTSAEKSNVDVEFELTEVFPATVNNEQLTGELFTILNSGNYRFTEKKEPFKWSEDFGHFSDKYPSCYFGIGAGKDTPALHNPDYDFPDDITEGATKLLINIVKKYHG